MSGLIWIKLYLNIFDDLKIREIMQGRKGREVVLLFLILLVEAGKTNKGGKLLVSQKNPHTVETLELISGMDRELVEEGLLILKERNLIAISKAGVISIKGYLKNQDPKRYEEKLLLANERKKNWKKRKGSLDKEDFSCENENNGMQRERKENKKGTPIDIEIELEGELEEKRKDNDDKREGSSSSSSMSGVKKSKVVEFYSKSQRENKDEGLRTNLTKKLREACFEKVSANLVDKLLSDCNTFGEAWVMEAISECDLRGIRSYAYLKKILENWKSKGKWNEGSKAGFNVEKVNEEAYKMYDFRAEMGDGEGYGELFEQPCGEA